MKDRVQIIENELKVSLPNDYKEFIEQYGCMNKSRFEIYGLANNFVDIHKIPSVIGATILYKKDYPLPNNHIVISHTGYKNFIVVLNTLTGHIYKMDNMGTKSS